jgi:hypothetical protein
MIMKITGTLYNRVGHDELDRVVALGEGRTVLAEFPVAPDHRWTFEFEGQRSAVVGQLKGRRIAAAFAHTEAADEISIPDLVQIDFQFEPPSANAALWIDPVALDGFPDAFLWALRSHADGSVDLHVGEFTASKPLTLWLQRGKYRISGGCFSLRPDATGREEAITIEYARNEKTGNIIRSKDQEIVLDVHGDDQWRLLFTPDNHV